MAHLFVRQCGIDSLPQASHRNRSNRLGLPCEGLNVAESRVLTR